jgi:nicotinamidase-related amidase
MTTPMTLLQLARADLAPPALRHASLVMIDFQHEYLAGPLALPGAAEAVEAARRLLERARRAGAPVFHVAHRGRAGGLFDREAERGQIIGAVAPIGGEPVVEKALPNAFAGTPLHDHLTKAARTNVVIAGFMTHMCVSSTARAGLDLGYRVTIDASACGTRDLPGVNGGVVPARQVHEVALSELADRFAIVVPSSAALV